MARNGFLKVNLAARKLFEAAENKLIMTAGLKTPAPPRNKERAPRDRPN